MRDQIYFIVEQLESRLALIAGAHVSTDSAAETLSRYLTVWFEDDAGECSGDFRIRVSDHAGRYGHVDYDIRLDRGGESGEWIADAYDRAVAFRDAELAQ